jgi:membrane-associated phospholipid phosphatase
MKRAPIGGLHPQVRPAEWLALTFFAYTAVLAAVLSLPHEMRVRTVTVSAAILASMCGLVLPGSWFSSRIGQGTRDCYLLALVPVAYTVMGWFAPERHDYVLERLWIRWDHVILTDWSGQRVIESFGSAGPWLLEVVYLLVYAVGPFCVLMLYAFKREHQTGDFLLTYLLGLFLSYAQFPFWPSEPPRAVFPGDLEPLASPVRTLNLYIVGNAGIHTSVFPSAHVSGAFAAALAFWRIFSDKNWLRCGLVVYAILVSIATVYGRYHYAIDAVAGLVVAVVAFYVARLVIAYRWRLSNISSVSPFGRSESTRTACSSALLPSSDWLRRSFQLAIRLLQQSRKQYGKR